MNMLKKNKNLGSESMVLFLKSGFLFVMATLARVSMAANGFDNNHFATNGQSRDSVAVEIMNDLSTAFFFLMTSMALGQ